MMGISETIASSVDEYVDIAVRLGNDNEWRLTISKKISERKDLIYRDRACIDALQNFIENIVGKK
jgi:predicted O-linked N-acetylglucosamine transferase (SPINDLY family)